MSAPRSLVRVLIGAVAAAALLAGPPSLAQVTPAAGYTPPDDTPTIKVGATIFTEYSYQDEPLASAVDGTTTKTYHPAAFNVTRAYINITGNISHNVSFRVTPDVSRLTTTTTGLASGEKVSTSMDGSLTYRL